MNQNLGTVRLHVGPHHHPWRRDVEVAVERGGAVVSAAEEAVGLIWLARGAGEGLDEILGDHLRWVQLRSAGIDQWNATGGLDRTRIWTTTRGVYAETVAEHALTLMLMGLKEMHVYTRASSWEVDSKQRGRLLGEMTVAVAGAGGIGQQLIRYLEPMSPHVIAVTRRGRVVAGAHENVVAGELGAVLPRADVIVLAAPATDQTHHLIGSAELETMRPNAWLVNVGRGTLIDTEALVVALKGGGIGGAALDVTDPEPLPDGHPLWSEPRAIITPHAANPGIAQLPRLSAFITENVRRFVTDEELLGRVDHDAGY